MLPRSEKTRDYILLKVAPLFSRLGYHGTSMSAITKATGLTKGAVYGNFQDKQDLVLQAFEKNITRVVSRVKEEMNHCDTAADKLIALTGFYRNYLSYSEKYGGCPILNFGVDSKFQNKQLLASVKSAVNRLQRSIEVIILDGIKAGEIKQDADAKKTARLIFAILEGAVFMAFVNTDKSYMAEAADHIDERILKPIIV